MYWQGFRHDGSHFNTCNAGAKVSLNPTTKSSGCASTVVNTPTTTRDEDVAEKVVASLEENWRGWVDWLVSTNVLHGTFDVR